MPGKSASTSKTPKYKVEEVVEEPVVPEPVAPPEPKISSFSMMDAKSVSDPTPEEVPAKVDEEPKEKEDTEPVSQAPEETPPPEPPTDDSQVSSSEIQEWLQSVRPETGTSGEMPQSPSGKGKYLAIFLVILILAALGGGIYYYRSNVEPQKETTQEKTPEKTEETTQEPTVEPSPTTAPVDVTKYKLQVLNGSGVAGEAGKAQSYLQTAGFKDVKAGNAGSFGFEATEVSMKKDTPDEVFTKIKSTLEVYYQEVVKAEKELDAKSTYDVVVTVGKKK